MFYYNKKAPYRKSYVNIFIMSKRQIKQKQKQSEVIVDDIYSEEEALNSDSEQSNKKQQTKKKSRQRQENSLGELTKNFINCIKDQGNSEININEIVKKLKVKKRRIYDITNVLEGKK
jgi:hypothetical protein